MEIFVSLIDGVKVVNETIDFSKEILGSSDIISISPCIITGELEMKNEQLYAYLKVNVDLVIASSRSLKPVDHKLNFDLDLVFGTGSDSDYPLENKINFDEIIYGHILLEKPLSIYLEDEPPIEKPKVTNPAFKDLEDWKI